MSVSSSIYVDARHDVRAVRSARIHLVRHCPHADVGHVLTGRAEGAPLTSSGAVEAGRLAAGLAHAEKLAAVHCSPRLRTRQTADAIAAAAGVTVEAVPALDEIDFGEWTGRSFAALEREPGWRDWNSARVIARPPRGETMAEAVARATAHIDALAGGAWDGAVVCVTHCDIIRGVVAHYLGLTLDNMLRFDVDPGSVTTLTIGAWGGRLQTLNREFA